MSTLATYPPELVRTARGSFWKVVRDCIRDGRTVVIPESLYDRLKRPSGVPVAGVRVLPDKDCTIRRIREPDVPVLLTYAGRSLHGREIRLWPSTWTPSSADRREHIRITSLGSGPATVRRVPRRVYPTERALSRSPRRSRHGLAGWSNVFRRSTMAPAIWSTRVEEIRRLVLALGMPVARSGPAPGFSGVDTEAVAFLDGGFLEARKDGPAFGCLNGTWIIGVEAMLWACHELGLASPPETDAISVAATIHKLERQRLAPRPLLTEASEALRTTRKRDLLESLPRVRALLAMADLE